jgi:hypothetical protein
LTQTVPWPVACPPAACSEDLSAPYRHRYVVVVVHLALLWFVRGHVSCRAVSFIWASLLLLLPFGAPCHETVRLWALRVGLFLLRRVLPRYPDWVFIVDSTIRLGNRKCLIILGGRLGRLAHLPGAPCLQDVMVLDVAVTTQCNAAFVEQRLDTVRQRVGPAQQIVSDHSGEMTKGLKLHQAKCPGVVATYDVTHQLALLVEAELEADGRWAEFVKGCSASLPKLQQTAGAFLMPPSLRTQARYMNVAEHVGWAQKVLGVLDRQDVDVLARELKVRREEALLWLEQRLGWLRGFRGEVVQYARLMEIVKVVEKEVKNEGLSRQTPQRVQELLAAGGDSEGRWAGLLAKVRDYLDKEAGQVPQGQTWLGSSDLIESLIGAYKYASEDAPFPEIGANVLLLPLLSTPLSGTLVRMALQSVSTADVRVWVQQNVGDSTLAKIRGVLIPPDTPDPPACPAEHKNGMIALRES